MIAAWLSPALRDLPAQLSDLAERNPYAAYDMNTAIDNAALRHPEQPRIGRPGRLEGTRELMIRGTPFMFVYRIEADRILILRPLHSAQSSGPQTPEHPQVDD